MTAIYHALRIVDGKLVIAAYHGDVDGKGQYTYGVKNVVVRDFDDNFDCGNSVLKEFDCRDCEIGILKIAHSTEVTSLNGIPSNIESFAIRDSELQDLNCSYADIQNFAVSDNSKLTSLENGPRTASDYNAIRCDLQRLGCPELELNTFNVSANVNLKSLADGPKRARFYHASKCDLRSLNCPDLSVQDFSIRSNVNLQTLADGPKTAKTYNAYGCDIRDIGGRDKAFKTLNLRGNAHVNLSQVPIVKLLILDQNASKLLYMCGRNVNVSISKEATDSSTSIDSDIITPTTVFRQKLQFIQSGLVKQATL